MSPCITGALVLPGLQLKSACPVVSNLHHADSGALADEDTLITVMQSPDLNLDVLKLTS